LILLTSVKSLIQASSSKAYVLTIVAVGESGMLLEFDGTTLRN